VSALHPFLTHFPIALITTATVMQFIVLIHPNWMDSRAPIWIFGFSLAMSFSSMLSGQAAANIAINESGLGEQIQALIAQHKNFATFTVWISLVVLIGWLWLYFRFPGNRRVDLVVFAFLLLLTVAVVFTGYFGGELVMRYGVGVGQL
tara:strand:+ start:55 stop:498 length:444 start_codon:yes stop_codon:yes gene_type:complete